MTTPRANRPVGRPPNPEPLRALKIKLSDADLARLDTIARRIAGPGGHPTRTAAIREAIRGMIETMDQTEGGQSCS